MKNWKTCECKIAALLGGERVPVSGRGRGHSPDIRHEDLSMEVKNRKRLPAWLEYAMKQAEASAQEGQLPLVILYQDGQRYQEALVVMRLKRLVQQQGDEG